MRMIAERVLPAEGGRTFVQGELANQTPELPPPRCGEKVGFHVYCSHSNPGPCTAVRVRRRDGVGDRRREARVVDDHVHGRSAAQDAGAAVGVYNMYKNIGLACATMSRGVL